MSLSTFPLAAASPNLFCVFTRLFGHSLVYSADFNIGPAWFILFLLPSLFPSGFGARRLFVVVPHSRLPIVSVAARVSSFCTLCLRPILQIVLLLRVANTSLSECTASVIHPHLQLFRPLLCFGVRLLHDAVHLLFPLLSPLLGRFAGYIPPPTLFSAAARLPLHIFLLVLLSSEHTQSSAGTCLRLLYLRGRLHSTIVCTNFCHCHFTVRPVMLPGAADLPQPSTGVTFLYRWPPITHGIRWSA